MSTFKTGPLDPDVPITSPARIKRIAPKIPYKAGTLFSPEFLRIQTRIAVIIEIPPNTVDTIGSGKI